MAPAPRSPAGRLVSWWQRARAVYELKSLSDSQLRDIGLERRDIDTLVPRNLNRFRSR